MKTYKNYIPFFLAFIIIIVLLSSCVVTKFQKERFLEKYCERKDSASYVKKDSIIKHDSIVYLSLPGTIQYLENPCKLLCDSLGNLKKFEIKKAQNNGVKSNIFKIGNSIGFKSYLDSAKIALSWNEHHTKEIDFSHTENTVKQECKLQHKSKFDGFTFWFFWIITSILLIRFGGAYVIKILSH